MEPLIREAKPEDKPFIEEIARLTWEGEDYLARVFESWLKDGNFYVLELEGKVIGTAKLTILPDKVGWLEGLRIHLNYQKRGFGRALHNFMLQKGKELAEMGVIDALEFSTYFLNKESIAMAKKDGFKLVKRFYYIQKPLGEKIKPKRTKIGSLDELDYKDYIPYGWKFLHKCKESLEWLNKKAEIREYSGLKFFYAPMHENEPTFTPFRLSAESIEALLPAMSFEAGKIGYDSIDIMLPEERRDLIEPLKKLGFKNWTDFKEPDVLVFRMKL
ncbi:GNAT family N-acetyltransferase [Thermococcus sp. M39]|uniref:GNAT family N-acetyltransferase n=1 Tax=unclassified Thermococcus TaxID=2627626 RepID=UPI00143C8AB7|nr:MULTISPECIES: GNAT family N-acetyltransferase [unclassified Thermococcus]NJE08638.1 GNAT family N-acetyltransferase [Thermococcus sp. M39]NJE13247.1 GNAT family N-acetyltransferase [Thermococcus sp. LS2]